MLGWLLRLIYYTIKGKPDVSDEWLRDEKRRSLGVGVEQPTSQWPWPPDGRW